MTRPRAFVCALAIMALSVACSGPRTAPSAPGSARRTSPRPAVVAVATATPAHSEEKEKEKDESYGLWRGGRHPQWRGCRHTFQPAVSAWVFGSEGRRASPEPPS
jgi:hypothetical protein